MDHPNTKHGHARRGKRITVEYRSWCHMKERCDNPKDKSYADYGGRGITYEPAWKSFSVFIQDLGYSKTNCIWATSTQQNRNKRSNLRLTYKEATKTALEWATLLGIRVDCLYSRYYKHLNNPDKYPYDNIFRSGVRTRHGNLHKTKNK